MSETLKRKIVTHYNPDLDGICSIWLIVRWLPEWTVAEFELVPAGKTYRGRPADSNPGILHVDTGLGKLDHHQTEKYTCAAKKTLEYVRKLRGEGKIRKKMRIKHGAALEWKDEALERLVEVVNQVDHFQKVYYPDPEADFYQFMAEAILDGWSLIYRGQDKLIIKKGLEVFDAIYASLSSEIEAEDILESGGSTFQTKWGPGVAVETSNSKVVSLAQKRGFKIAVLKHPTDGHVKIKTPPIKQIQNSTPARRKLGAGERYGIQSDSSIDLTEVYKALKEKDPAATWFLHSSKTMILNGSAKNPKMKATKLKMEAVVKVIQNISEWHSRRS